MGEKHQIRYAVLGTANIAHKLWKAIYMSKTGRIQVVASRSIEKAQHFIDECQSLLPFTQAPEAVHGYESAISRKDIDVVYIPIPTGLRKEWVIKAAEQKKHVLVEKPVGCSIQDVEEMVDACRRNNVHFMDGVMFMHSSRLPALHAKLSDLGKIRHITSQFCFKADEDFFKENIRVAAVTEPLGCLGDLGWYNIRFTLFVKDWALPQEVRGTLHKQSEEGVPFEISGEMKFKDDTSASFFCSFLTHEVQTAVINGEKATIRLDDFVLPHSGRHLSFDINHQAYVHEGLDQVVYNYTEKVWTAEAAYGHPTAQESKMIAHMNELAQEGILDTRWAEFSLKTQLVLDTILVSAKDKNGQWVKIQQDI